jgi:DNA invertase Pin-like site-specific DNA recombinase
VENQIRECREYVYKIAQKGDEVIEFSEPDSSTKKPMAHRKKLIEMMARLRKDDQLVVYKVDRLARDKQELVNIYCNISKIGVEIVGLKDPSLSDDTILMYAMIAYAERKNIQQRTVSGLNRKKSNMERVGTTWYGYRLDESQLNDRQGAKSEGKPYKLLEDEAESKQVALMVDWLAAGYSYGQIAHELSAKGFQNRKGNPVEKSTVYRVLRRLGMERPIPMVEGVG